MDVLITLSLSLCPAHSDALSETEHCGGSIPRICENIYEADVPLARTVPRLGSGRSGIGQHHTGLNAQTGT